MASSRRSSSDRQRAIFGWPLLFLPMGALLLVIGVLDLVSAGSLEARALGLVFSVIGGLMCATGLLAGAPRGLVQVAAIAGIVVGLIFASAAWPDFGRPWPTVACIGGFAVACLCAIVAVRSWRSRASTPGKEAKVDREGRVGVATVTTTSAGRPKPDDSSNREVIVTSAATLVAAILALVGTWYGASYAPAVTQPALNVTAEFEDVGEGTDLRAVPVVVTAKNAGTRTLRLLQSYYEVHGVQVAATPEESSEMAMAAPFREGEYDGPVQRFSLGTSTTTSKLIQFGRAFEDGAGLVPNEEITSRVLIHIPKHWKDIQGLRIVVDIAAVRQDQVPLPTEPSDGPYVVQDAECWEGQTRRLPCIEVETAWPVQRSSIFERIVNHPRCVYTGVDVYARPRLDLHGGIPESPGNYAFVADEACGSPVSKTDDKEFWVSTVTEQSLWETKDLGTETGKARKT